MKKLIKFVSIIAISLLVSVGANAQFKLGAHLGLENSTEDGAKALLGGGISGEYLVMPNIGVGLSAGYYAYSKDGATISLIPVTLNGRYYFLTESIQPYAGLDLGLYSMGDKVKVAGKSVSSTDSYFGLAPVVGLQFKLTDALALDVNVSYNHIFSKGESTGMLGAKLGVVYTFGF